MKAREKLLIVISVLACGVSIAIFALVSLGHFIYTPGHSVVPIVGKMYQTTVREVALLEPVPVPQTPKPVTNNSNPAPAPQPTQSTASAKQTTVAAKNSKNYKSPKKTEQKYTYNDFKKALEALFGLR